jgi:hypothetical protein
MGSLISKPPKPAPVIQAPPPPPAPEVKDDAAEPDRAAARRRAAMPDTVHTSYRGVLAQGSWVPQRKSLLGE